MEGIHLLYPDPYEVHSDDSFNIDLVYALIILISFKLLFYCHIISHLMTGLCPVDLFMVSQETPLVHGAVGSQEVQFVGLEIGFQKTFPLHASFLLVTM